MSETPEPPRVAPLGIEDMSPEALELLAKAVVNDEGTVRLRRDDDPVHPFPATMLHFPRLYQRFGVFAGQVLMRGTLPARERELVCLRVGWLCRAAMEFGEHVPIAKSAGLTSADVENVVAGPDAPAWDEDDRALLRAVDELHTTGGIAEPTWQALARRFDVRQLLELPMLVGAYHTVAFVQNALRIELPPGNDGLEAR